MPRPALGGRFPRPPLEDSRVPRPALEGGMVPRPIEEDTFPIAPIFWKVIIVKCRMRFKVSLCKYDIDCVQF